VPGERVVCHNEGTVGDGVAECSSSRVDRGCGLHVYRERIVEEKEDQVRAVLVAEMFAIYRFFVHFPRFYLPFLS
jgi:hypothetical protein